MVQSRFRGREDEGEVFKNDNPFIVRPNAEFRIKFTRRTFHDETFIRHESRLSRNN